MFSARAVLSNISLIPSSMPHVKKIIQNILRFQGYEIIRCNRFGASAVMDIGALFRGRPLQTIFDVGANQGQTALSYSDSFPEAKIHSFEPFFRGLIKNPSVATTACSNVTAVQCALGEAPASETLFILTNSPRPISCYQIPWKQNASNRQAQQRALGKRLLRSKQLITIAFKEA